MSCYTNLAGDSLLLKKIIAEKNKIEEILAVFETYGGTDSFKGELASFVNNMLSEPYLTAKEN